MGFWTWFLIVVLGAAALSIVFFFGPFFVIAGVLYTTLLVRQRPDKWGRECSIPDDEEYQNMFQTGLDWAAENAAHKRDVDIHSGKYHLYGEYFDFGADRAVLIIAGRMESLLYSYYFAEPYKKAGYNILVIDNRSHGKSDGKFTSLGYREYKDILAWSKFLHDELGNRSVIYHGICIGASTGLFALTSKDAPDYLDGIIAEGMYTTFAESFKNHLIERGKPLFPMQPFVMAHVYLWSHANVYGDGPFKRVKKLHKPILFIYSKEDTYSTPEQAQRLYNDCASEQKEIVWFDRGAHSRVRINFTEEYDRCIRDYISRVFDKNTYVNG